MDEKKNGFPLRGNDKGKREETEGKKMAGFVNINLKVPNWLDKICAWPAVVYRQWKNGYTYRRIYLGESFYAILDEEDYYIHGRFRWSIYCNGSNIYAIRNILQKNGKSKLLLLHKEILKTPKRRVVDHKNGNSLDDRRDNLRIATYLQNSYNRRKKRNTTSKYIGVSLHKKSKRWEVKIKNRNKHIWIGRFKNEIDAARAYDRAAL